MTKNITTNFKFTASALTAQNNAGTVDVDIYDEIVSGDMPSWYGGISATSFLSELEKHKGKNLNIRINSPGGYVFDGVAIYNRLKGWDKNVTVTVDGICASIATVIALAGKKVKMKLGTFWMIHNPSSWGRGTAADMRKIAEDLEIIASGLCDIYKAHTGQSLKKIKDWMDAETWFSPAEALKFGFIQEVEDTTAARATACAAAENFRNIPEAAKLLLKNFSSVPPGGKEGNAGKGESGDTTKNEAGGRSENFSPAENNSATEENGVFSPVALNISPPQTANENQTKNNEKTTMNKTSLVALLAALNIAAREDNTDAAFDAAIALATENAKKTAAALAGKESEVTAHNETITKLKAQLEKQAAATAEQAVSSAVKSGKIKADAKAGWIANYTAAPAETQALLDSIPAPAANGTAPLSATDSGASGTTENPWKKGFVNYTKQAEITAKTPELAKQLKAEAGAK